MAFGGYSLVFTYRIAVHLAERSKKMEFVADLHAIFTINKVSCLDVASMKLSPTSIDHLLKHGKLSSFAVQMVFYITMPLVYMVFGISCFMTVLEITDWSHKL